MSQGRLGMSQGRLGMPQHRLAVPQGRLAVAQGRLAGRGSACCEYRRAATLGGTMAV